jgi:hypothetical protein
VLSVEVRMVPLSPTIIDTPFPDECAQRLFDVPDVLEVHVVLSVEVRMVPVLPTATYNPLEVEVVVLSVVIVVAVLSCL